LSEKYFCINNAKVIMQATTVSMILQDWGKVQSRNIGRIS